MLFAPRTMAVMLLVAATIPVTTSAAKAAAAPAPCADVLYVGARGSGQPAAGSASDDGSGMGPQVYGSFQRMSQDLPTLRVSGLAVDYPARPAELLLSNSRAYFSGLEKGVASVKSTLEAQARSCPNQHIVLSGYSQGAMVMHRVLQDLVTQRTVSSRRVLRHVDGAILLADGDRLAHDRTSDLGTAKQGSGISHAFGAESGARGKRLPGALRSRVFSVCESADVICDYRSLLQANSSGVDGVTVHTTQYTGSADVMTATDAVAARVSGH